jgi:hypothetical protein
MKTPEWQVGSKEWGNMQEYEFWQTPAIQNFNWVPSIYRPGVLDSKHLEPQCWFRWNLQDKLNIKWENSEWDLNWVRQRYRGFSYIMPDISEIATYKFQMASGFCSSRIWCCFPGLIHSWHVLKHYISLNVGYWEPCDTAVVMGCV